MESLSAKNNVCKLQKHLNRSSRTRILAGASPERPNTCKEINFQKNNGGTNMSGEDKKDNLNPCQAKTIKSNERRPCDDNSQPSIKNPCRTTRQCMEPVEKPTESYPQRNQRQCAEPVDRSADDCQQKNQCSYVEEPIDKTAKECPQKNLRQCQQPAVDCQQRSRRPCPQPVNRTADNFPQKNSRPCTDTVDKNVESCLQKNNRPEVVDRTVNDCQQKSRRPCPQPVDRTVKDCQQENRQQCPQPVNRIADDCQQKYRRPCHQTVDKTLNECPPIPRPPMDPVERPRQLESNAGYNKNQQPPRQNSTRDYDPVYCDDITDMRNGHQSRGHQQQQLRPQQRQQQRLAQDYECESGSPPNTNRASSRRPEQQMGSRKQQGEVQEETEAVACRPPQSESEMEKVEMQRLNLLRRIELHQRALVLETQELLKNEQEQLRQRIQNEKLKMLESPSRYVNNHYGKPEPQYQKPRQQQSGNQSRQTQWEPPACISQPQQKRLLNRPPTPITDCSLSGDDSIEEQLQQDYKPKKRMPYVLSSQTDSCTSDEFDGSQTGSDTSEAYRPAAINPPMSTYTCTCNPSNVNNGGMPSYPNLSQRMVSCPQQSLKVNQFAKKDERQCGEFNNVDGSGNTRGTQSSCNRSASPVNCNQQQQRR